MYRQRFRLLMVAGNFVLRVQRGSLQFHWWSSSLELESRYSFNPVPVLLSLCLFFLFGTHTKMGSLLWHSSMWRKGRRNNSIFCEIVCPAPCFPSHGREFHPYYWLLWRSRRDGLYKFWLMLSVYFHGTHRRKMQLFLLPFGITILC